MLNRNNSKKLILVFRNSLKFAISIIFISVLLVMLQNGNSKGLLFRNKLTVFSQVKNFVKISVGGKELKVEIVQTPKKKFKGLSNRKYLEPNKGMLFIYPKPAKYRFCMRDMFFPIDILWIKGDEIVDIDKNVPCFPELSLSELPKYKPTQPVTRILEVNSGFVDENNIKIGDKVKILNMRLNH